MSGNGLFFEKSNDELIWPPGGREILEGGRASWLVPFGVINHYTEGKPPPRERGRRNTEEVGASPPPKPPPKEKGREKGREEERGRERKKKTFMREKNNKKLLTNERKKIL